jgi:putative transposase
MDNHVHLLLTPATADSLAMAMRASGQSYVQAFNTRHRRSGTLWQGRFHSCLVDSDRYLLTVCRYIELNPVRAALVAAPQEYRWSSIHAHLGMSHDPLITLHPTYLALGTTAETRAATYREWLDAGISDDELAKIRRYISQQRALGDSRFQDMVEKTLNRAAAYRPGGRPRTKVT